MSTTSDPLSTTTDQLTEQPAHAVGPDPDELAQAAKRAAGKSSATGRAAWSAVAVAIATGRTEPAARLTLEETLPPGLLRDLAQSFLQALCTDTTEETR